MELTKGCLTTMAMDLSELMIEELDGIILELNEMKARSDADTTEQLDCIIGKLGTIKVYFE